MPKDIKKIIKRLMNISQKVLDEFETLSFLSFHDKEDTKEFDVHIESTKSFLNSEAVILNNLDLDTLKEIFRSLPEYDDESMAYERTYINIDNKIEELGCTFDEEETNEEIDETDYEDNEDDAEEEESGIQKYYLDDEENEKYEELFINYINIFVLKRIYDRILNTTSDNKNDNKYKKRLLKHLKQFKYLVLSQNLEMEKIGVNYRFNISKMPYLSMPDIDTSTIAYNHCILILEKLYNPVDNNDLDDIYISLFNMMCFEAYLSNVSSENYDKLLMVCEELKAKSKNTYYGEIAKDKILTKTKN